jgi:hypothetical protein
MESSIFAPSLKVASARRKFIRWTRDNSNPTAKARGTVIAHYLVYKLMHEKVNQRLKTDNFFKLKNIFEEQDLSHIKKELINSREQTVVLPLPLCKNQVTNFRVLHHRISEMNAQGTPYLHSLLNGLVKKALPKKKYYDAYYFSNATPKKRKGRRGKKKPWVPCEFHEDIEGHDEWNFTDIEDDTPLTFYFPVGDKPIALDMAYQTNNRQETPKLGRPRKNPVLKIILDPGDILIFATTMFTHRSSAPLADTKVPDRVNIILSGIWDSIELTYNENDDDP